MRMPRISELAEGMCCKPLNLFIRTARARQLNSALEPNSRILGTRGLAAREARLVRRLLRWLECPRPLEEAERLCLGGIGLDPADTRNLEAPLAKGKHHRAVLWPGGRGCLQRVGSERPQQDANPLVAQRALLRAGMG
eukprot:scaffold254_cov129-Isochrysis_galbana.AAC.4